MMKEVVFQWWVYISCQLLSNVSKKMGGGHECGCVINFFQSLVRLRKGRDYMYDD